MAMRISDRILSAPRGTAAASIAYATSNGASRLGEVTAYIQEVYRLAPFVGVDPSIAVAQSVHETSTPSHPWNSYWWVERLNPAGLGITGDPTENLQSHIWPNGTASAQSHLAHLLVYALGPADAGSLWFQKTGQSIMAVDPRYEAYVAAYGNTVQAETIAELGGTWATDTQYGPKVAARGNAIYPNLPDQEGPPLPTFTTNVPGLPGGPLVTSYPIRLNMIPPGNVRQRPGIKAKSPRRSVQHGTGNATNPSAMAEAQYFVNGAEGRQASVHYCTDDREVVVVVPLDEVTWQAADGGGPGNMNGFSCEMSEANVIWNDTVRRDNLVFVTADIMGRTAARLGATVPEQHWTFNAGAADRHDCPNKLRHTTLFGRPAWDVYAERWQAARADELVRMAGGTPTTTTTAPPVPPLVPRVPIVEPADAPNRTFWFEGRLYQRVSPARLKLVRSAVQYARPDGRSLAARESLPAGKAVSVPYVVDGDDGGIYRASKAGTYIRLANFTERRP